MHEYEYISTIYYSRKQHELQWSIVNKNTTFGFSSFVQQMPLGGDGKAERLLPRFYADRVAVDLIRLPLDDRIGAEAFGVMQVEDSIRIPFRA